MVVGTHKERWLLNLVTNIIILAVLGYRIKYVPLWQRAQCLQFCQTAKYPHSRKEKYLKMLVNFISTLGVVVTQMPYQLDENVQQLKGTRSYMPISQRLRGKIEESGKVIAACLLNGPQSISHGTLLLAQLHKIKRT